MIIMNSNNEIEEYIMHLKEDCVNFGYIEKDITGIGDLVKKTKSIPNRLSQNQLFTTP